MKKYFSILMMGLLALMVACSKDSPVYPPRPTPPPIEYEEVLHINFGKVWQGNAEGTGYFSVDVVFPNEYYEKLPKENVDDTGRPLPPVGAINLHNYRENKLWFGTGEGYEKGSYEIRPFNFLPGDGVDEKANAHHYSARFNCQVGTFDLRLEFESNYGNWCTPKYRVVIGKDTQGLWTVDMQLLKE